MSDIVKLYNPANANTLTPEQIQGLQKLTSAEIKLLASAYPNATMIKAYLLIIDNKKPIEKQLPSISTFENLYNLRERNGQRNFVAYAFRSGYKPTVISPVRKKTEIVDLSDTELLTLPGFKTSNEVIPPEKVEIKHVNRRKKTDDELQNEQDVININTPIKK